MVARCVASGSDERICGALFRAGPAIVRARDTAAGDAVAGLLLGSLGASADGAVGVRSAVPLVRRARYGRSGVGSLVEAGLWDRDSLDLVEPAYMTFAKNGRGEFAFGVVNATMELGYGQR